MEQKGISVIIPLFNSEEYIEVCLRSIMRQGQVIHEIICVNDGSTDRSSEILEQLQKEDARIQVLNSNHTGVSAARNMGLQAATGRYIMFVDSDDYLRKRKLDKFYKRAISWDADILVFGGTSCKPFQTPHWVRRVSSPQKGKVVLKEPTEILKRRGVLPATWNKLYKRELIKDLKFPTELRIAEDNVFQFYAFLRAKKVMFCSERIYVYRVHSGSAMQTLTEEKEKQHELAVEIVEKKLEENGLLKECESAFEEWKRLLVSHSLPVKRGKMEALLHYAREYGVRSLIEYIIGKIIEV